MTKKHLFLLLLLVLGRVLARPQDVISWSDTVSVHERSAVKRDGMLAGSETSCQQSEKSLIKSTCIDSKKLTYKNHLYIYKKRLVSGEVCFRPGVIRTFKKGVPNGKWEYFGYDGGLIQHGNSYPVCFPESTITISNKKIPVFRISFEEFYEGIYAELYVLIISDATYKNEEADEPILREFVFNKLPPELDTSKFKKIIYRVVDREYE